MSGAGPANSNYFVALGTQQKLCPHVSADSRGFGSVSLVPHTHMTSNAKNHTVGNGLTCPRGSSKCMALGVAHRLQDCCTIYMSNPSAEEPLKTQERKLIERSNSWAAGV